MAIPPLHTFTDIHSHSAVGPDVLTSVEPLDRREGQYGSAWYSVGIHPWSTTDPLGEDVWQALSQAMDDPRVIAVGECGLDKNRGGESAAQEDVFIRQAKLAQQHGKALIIHCVGRYGRLLELHKALRPTVPWIVHGFSGKPELARQLTAAGIAISLGPRSRPDVADAIPAELCYRETDK